MNARPRSARALLLSTVLALLTPVPFLAGGQPTGRLSAAAVQPKAFVAVPGPDAEYLLLSDRYTLRDDGTLVHERRSRLQVNSYLAINRRYGETKVGWDPAVETFEVVQNRTVLPSGQIVDAPPNAVVDDQPPAAEGNPLWNGLRRKIIVHTALEPGAVMEETYRITRNAPGSPRLDLGEPLATELPIRERVVEVDMPKDLSLGAAAMITPTQVEVGGRIVWTWHRTNVAAVPEEPGAPAREEALPYLWLSTGGDRKAIAPELARRVELAGPAPASALAAARGAMVSGTAWETRLLAALTAMTGALNVSRISPSVQHWQLQPLSEVWRAGCATPLELAALEASVLTACGFAAQVALLAPPDRDARAAPGFAGFERALVRVEAEDGGVRLYDPAEPTAGGPLEASLVGVLLVPGWGDTDALPAPRPWRRELTATARVKENGSVAGSLALAAAGSATPQAMLVRDPGKLADELVRGLFPNGKPTGQHVTELARLSAALGVDFEGELPARNQLGFIRLTVAGVPGGADEELPHFPVPTRHAPMALPGPGIESVDLTLTLPKGWTVAALPGPTRVSNSLGTVEVTSSQGADGTVHIVRRIDVRKRIVPAAQAVEVRDLLTAWRSPASRELLLRVPEAAPQR